MTNAQLYLLEPAKERYRGHGDEASTDQEGRYSFKGIPPGRYVLIIRFDGSGNQDRPFPIIYYPGVSNLDEAQLFTIAESSRIPDADLIMPPLPTDCAISGTVVGPDDKPVTSARVEYRVLQEVVTYGTDADTQGRFSFRAYDGLTLSIRASLKRQDKTFYSNWVEVKVAPGLAPVKIVFLSQ